MQRWWIFPGVLALAAVPFVASRTLSTDASSVDAPSQAMVISAAAVPPAPAEPTVRATSDAAPVAPPAPAYRPDPSSKRTQWKEGPNFPVEGYPFDTSGIVIVSRDGRQRFTVPKPSDPEWEDYLEMKRHRQFQSAFDGREGHAIPYDPEWRSMVEGKRHAPPVDQELLHAYPSLDQVAREVLLALQFKDADALVDLHVDQEEFEVICWPSFPQSRPYVRIPVAEAWGFHYASCHSGIDKLLRLYGGRPLDLTRVRTQKVMDYDNFKLYEGVVIEATDRDTGNRVEIPYVDSLIARNGAFKVFLYKD